MKHQTTQNQSKLVTAKELLACGIFPPQVTERAVKAMARKRAIPSIKVTRWRLFDPEAVLSHLRSHATILPH